MKVLHINTTDIGGGAEQAMLDVHHALTSVGHQSYCLVGVKKSNWDFIGQLSSPQVFQRIKNERDRKQGREVVEFPSILKRIDRLDFAPDVVHIHNLHGDYIDIRELPELSHKHKVVIHLHDMWLLTGHCAQAILCDRWQSGCGNCPDLKLYPAIEKDATDYNWKRKREILEKSKLHFIGPSNWIAEQMRSSGIAYESIAVIPNGVDTAVFKPGDKAEARNELGLGQDKFIVLFSARNPSRNEFKDYKTLEQAVKLVAKKAPEEEIELICLGETGAIPKPLEYNNLTISFHPFTADRQKVARYYHAADVYAHATKAETFGKTIIEAMSCSTPVVAIGVGGTPELIEHGETGFLAEPQNAEQLAEFILGLKNPKKRQQISQTTLAKTGSKFDMKNISYELVKLYEQLG